MKDARASRARQLQEGPEPPQEDRIRLLIDRYKQGDDQAFTEIVRLYHRQVAALAFRIVRDYDDAADVSQVVFSKMVENIRHYDSNKKFYTWLYRITVNASIDYLRKHRRHRHESLEEMGEILESTQAESDPLRHLQQHQIGSHILYAANQLTDKQRSALLMRDVGGRPIDDIARIMDMPAATVRWYLHRARSAVRRELVRRCPQLLVSLGIR
jgi:RNA polymerase sigma-70 factor, ECF subfamily